MNPGFRGWARPRHKVFVGEPQTIDTTNGNTFKHGFGRVPGGVEITFVCVTANNGYTKGQEIPFTAVYRVAGANTDGRPFVVWLKDSDKVKVWVASANTDFQDASFNTVTFTASQWKVVVRCFDIERMK